MTQSTTTTTTTGLFAKAPATPLLGTAVNRKDGVAKVTGQAPYSADHPIEGLVHGYLVTSPIAKGRIRRIDTSAITPESGVLQVFTHQSGLKIFKPTNNWVASKIYEARLPLSDDQIHYAGQIVALVVADTFEQARAAAQLVQVDYDTQPPAINPDQASYQPGISFGEEALFETGAFKQKQQPAADQTLSATYHTEMELHAPMEPQATVAHWRDLNSGKPSVTIYEHSQWIAKTQATYSELLGIPQEQIHLVSPFIGGGFGSKAFPWPHAILCTVAARQLRRPLKVVLSRRQMTANAGHRSHTDQQITLGAKSDGQLVSISHSAKSCTSTVESFVEPCTGITPVMYAAPHLRLDLQVGALNVGTPTFMRAPGECPGMWALESAMDELAWKLGIDPVALRLKNQALQHQRKGLPFSEKHFAECLNLGAERFGWSQRPAKPGSTLRSGKRVGWGMAAATFPGYRGAASVKVRLNPDGTALVLTAGNDMGTGAYTVVAMAAAETLGLPVDRVRVEMGDSRLPDGGLAGGSQMTASLTPAVVAACQDALKKAGCSDAGSACKALQTSGQAAFEGSGSAAPGEEVKKWAFQSWGAHFCEVELDEDLARLRVTRWLSVMDIGRVINAKAAASQVRGGVIMGIGQALMEECLLDPNSGQPVVYDLATYHYPSHADIPRIEVAFVGKPDLNFNPVGARGVGEIGITGVSAAIANALYHATGKRVRSLPMTPDKLLFPDKLL
jgi:xanthine dehydrogenase YagR molybdenum-binding subunit